jgi:site-specific DNA-methyltransferase (adenine-specific)
MKIDIRLGDCLEVLKTIPDNSIDSVVTDPPYGLGFMNKEWDSPEKLRALTQRESDRSAERKAEGKSPTDAPFSKSVPPGLAIKGAKEGKWFQEWCELWAVECLRILKPGGHILSFSAPRTYHRMATAFEDAGFEIRDQLMWVFGSGFPKSHNIGKAIQKQSGDIKVIGTKQGAGTTGKSYISNNEEYVDGEKGVFKKEYDEIEINNDWEGWGTALKPAHEPIVMARKPLSEKSIAENVLKHGTGGINIDGSRIPFEDTKNAATNPKFRKENNYKMPEPGQESNGAVKFTSSKNEYDTSGRFPANIIFDEEAGQLLDEQSGISKSVKTEKRGLRHSGRHGGLADNKSNLKEGTDTPRGHNDKGGASRFFYCPKAAKKDRNEGLDNFADRPSQLNSGGIGRKISVEKRLEENGENAPTMKNNHPTVKPTDLMRYLINLVTPPNGTILDPFMGSGSTGKAAVRCGVNFIGIEKEQEYMDIASARIEHEQNKPTQTKLF